MSPARWAEKRRNFHIEICLFVLFDSRRVCHGDFRTVLEQHNTLSALRGLSLLLVILSNVIQWLQFTLSLNLAPSSVHAGLVNSGANFLATAVLARAVFGDPLPILWWMGSTLILIGMILMQGGGQAKEAEKETKPKTETESKVEEVKGIEKGGHVLRARPRKRVD